MGELDDAAEAYRQASAKFESARASIPALRLAKIQTRQRLAAAMVSDAKAGTPFPVIWQKSGYKSREMVRLILRAGGIEAD